MSQLLSDQRRADALADDVSTWLEDNQQVVGLDVTAWAASKAVDVAMAAIEHGAATPLVPEQLDRLAEMPVAARVASALHFVCGLTVDEVAAVAQRTPHEVLVLLGNEPTPAGCAPLPWPAFTPATTPA